MAAPTLLSVIESPTHRDYSAVYRHAGIQQPKHVMSMRKAISAVKKNPPDYLVGEFFYGYHNDYAGVTISNLDVMLYTLQKYATDTKVIVLVSKADRPHVDELKGIFPIHAILTQPFTPAQLLAPFA